MCGIVVGGVVGWGGYQYVVVDQFGNLFLVVEIDVDMCGLVGLVQQGDVVIGQ